LNNPNNFRYLVQSFLGTTFFGLPGLSAIRKRWYKRKFNMGDKPYIPSGVMLVSPHSTSPDAICIGNRVNIGRKVFIDYSGGLTIEDDVTIGREALIVTHRHFRQIARTMLGEGEAVVKQEGDFHPTPLTIGQGAYIGARAIILPGVKSIGRNAVISAGSVVRKSVPNNSIVEGNPAVVVFQARNPSDTD